MPLEDNGFHRWTDTVRTQRKTTQLTEAYIRALAAPQKGNVVVFDKTIRGLGIRVTAAGVKAFVLRYQDKDHVERRATIGRWPTDKVEVIRGEVASILYRLKNEGIDPLARKREQREAPTVNDMLDSYLSSARFAAKAPVTQAIDRGRLDRHIRPLLGKRILTELRPDAVERAFADIRDGKTAANVKTKTRGLARVRGGEGTARKAVRLFRAALSWATREGYIDRNPATGIDVGSDGSRQLRLDADGYVSMFNALDKLVLENQVSARAADAIRVIALTGARRGEIAGLRAEHIDLEIGLITIPPERHKTGKATEANRIIAVPEAAREILAKYVAEPIVFPFDGSALTKAWGKVRAQAGLQGGFGLHGLRHSVASHLAMTGAGVAEIMVAMGHRQMSTSQKYIHAADDERRKLAERAAGPALAGMRR